MNKLFFAVVFAALFFAACQPANHPDPATTKRENVLSVIHQRKSVRNFIPGKSVSKEDISILLKAAMAAPSAVNKQPWHFVVISDRAILDSLAAGLPYAKMLPSVSEAIVVCGDTTIKAVNMGFWEFDCSLASANILLAAEAMGLGAVWTAVHPVPNNITLVRRLLKLPDHIVPLNLIPIGYPTGEDQPKDKFKEERIHWNGF